MLYHARTSLAAGLADALQGKNPFSDAPNGLFLAAPRRTGKSTFLQADLMPELARRQVVGVYVDLWADQNRDPGTLIAEAVGRALLKQLGVVAKTARSAGLESINVGGPAPDEDPGPAEPEGSGRPSRTRRKTDALAAQRLGEALLELPLARLKALDLPERAFDAIVMAQ